MCDRRLIERLLRPAAYPHRVGRIQLEETHISWVILTGKYVYKIKKPLDLGFLDFRTLAQRRHYCNEELRLNRNWSPYLYLDVVPIVMSHGNPRVEGKGKPVEFAVRMRQFDGEMRLDRQLASGNLGMDDIRDMGSEIARRHLNATVVTASEVSLQATCDLIRDNYDALAGKIPARLLAEQRRWMENSLEKHDAFMQRRLTEGFFRECHGDLHLGNIVRLPQGIRAFDCIEFSPELREIDVVSDYAFLTMDLKARGATALASVFLNRYLEITGDYAGVRLLPMYAVYRSLVRAKILSMDPRDRRCGENAAGVRRTGIRRYCALAHRLTVRRRPALIAMNGYSGSGKSWISSQLMADLPGIRLRSDLERKRLVGLGATEDSHSGIEKGIYAQATTSTVYDRLLSTAGDLLDAGMNVIVDAAFLDAQHRQQARRTAADSRAAFVLVRTVASDTELRDRLRRRAPGAGVSEADLAVLQHQLGNADPLTRDELASSITVDTEVDAGLNETLSAIRRIADVYQNDASAGNFRRT